MDTRTTTRTTTRADLAADLRRIVGARLLDPLDILFGAGEELRERLGEQADQWADTLLGDDDQAAAFTAIRLVGALYPADGPFDPPPAWWGTPFGRAVFRRAGHPAADAVPFSVAAAVLGISRQGVHDLTVRGKLQRDPGGGVTVASVRARLASRTI
ncbi:hypothetical protein MF672_040605 [Actinomadura sp. ATCC 31491]|uniref:MftR C-terminal domain-containing protein n=1 Tax=Actinomadura luzonensis TaxID=2805427 RepID=A0ABT0G607_9ACTN|nr:hypothetical protein [Actinomadura luzonensis]MCK2220055.1 hypothetical protein [Actinomadura luzonensis]